MCLFYLIYFFFPFPALFYVLSGFCLAVYFSSVLNVKGVARFITLTLFLLALLINWNTKDAPFEIGLEGIQQNLPLLALISLVPMLSIPLKAGGYFHSIKHFMRKWEDQPRLAFFGLSSFLALISPILNMGSVKIVHEMVDKLRINPMILGKSYLIGFTSSMLWSPYFASVAIVLHEVGGRFNQYIVLGMAVALLQLIIGNLLFLRSSKKLYGNGKRGKEDLTGEVEDDQVHRGNLLKILCMLVVMIFSLLILEHVTRISMLTLVSLIAVFVPLLWAAVLNQWKVLATEFEGYLRKISHMDHEITLFLSAGLFGLAIRNTVFADQLQSFLMGFAEQSLLLFVLIIFLVVLFFAFIGVHQIVVIPILASQVSASSVGMSPEFLALIFIMSWSITAVLCPLNAINIIVSNCLERNGFTIGFRWNGTYVMSLVSILIVALTVYGLF
ncbi:hypothetical protein SAMN04487936_102388 [Halobacillus dabanensis]|uniref:Uncharacterized protein n=2 Tax=Halobacillus dabanensis TaxID=240302 RepID=A0A1I3RV64_HALDA|nr:hypothetical protein SAMN04487936_102388 [Halobacillus dabanensis]